MRKHVKTLRLVSNSIVKKSRQIMAAIAVVTLPFCMAFTTAMAAPKASLDTGGLSEIKAALMTIVGVVGGIYAVVTGIKLSRAIPAHDQNGIDAAIDSGIKTLICVGIEVVVGWFV